MRHAKPLLLTVLLALVIGVVLPAGVARAESYPGDSLDNPYLLDASQTVENPFPDKISDEDIATMSKQGPCSPIGSSASSRSSSPTASGSSCRPTSRAAP